MDGQCVDLYDFTGPIVQTFTCNGGVNQKWTYSATSKTFSSGGVCMGVGSVGDLEVWIRENQWRNQSNLEFIHPQDIVLLQGDSYKKEGNEGGG